MGYLTTITIYNDGIADLPQNAQEFADQVYAAAGSYYARQFPVDVRISGFCNFGKVHQPRHADDQTVYVHAGNTVCEMNINSEETNRLMKQNPRYFEKLLKEMWHQYRALRREFKNVANQNARQNVG